MMKKIIDCTYYENTDCRSIMCIWVYASNIGFDRFWIDNPTNPERIKTIVEWLNSTIAYISYKSVYEMYAGVTPYRRELARACADEIACFEDFDIDRLLEYIIIPADRAFAYECARLYGLM